MKSIFAARTTIIVLAGVLSTSSARTPADAMAGTFSLQGTEHCIHSSGFGPPPVLEALGPTVMEGITLHGTLTLRSDGTGELVGRTSSIATTSIGSPVQQSTLRCAVGHSLDRNGAVQLNRTCKGTVTRGSRSVGGHMWSTSSVALEGRYQSRAGILQLNDSALEVETVVSFHGARTPRLCTRAWSAFRIESPR